MLLGIVFACLFVYVFIYAVNRWPHKLPYALAFPVGAWAGMNVGAWLAPGEEAYLFGGGAVGLILLPFLVIVATEAFSMIAEAASDPWVRRVAVVFEFLVVAGPTGFIGGGLGLILLGTFTEDGAGDDPTFAMTVVAAVFFLSGFALTAGHAYRRYKETRGMA